MLIERIHHRLFFFLGMALLLLSLNGCATTAPVQEMSNARQSIRAATDANAEKYATNLLAEAKQRLRSAIRELDNGEYERARLLAVEAKQLALKARQVATSQNNKEQGF